MTQDECLVSPHHLWTMYKKILIDDGAAKQELLFPYA